MPSQTGFPQAASDPAVTSAPKSQRRRNYLIEKRFQLRVTGNFVLVLLASIVVSHAVTLGFLKFREWLDPASQSTLYVVNSVHDTLAFAQLLELIWRPMVASMLLGVICVGIFGIFYSHRMAGPLFNLKERLKELEYGNLNSTLAIRKNDEFHDVESAFNRMLLQVRERILKLESEVLGLSQNNRDKIQSLFKEMINSKPKSN